MSYTITRKKRVVLIDATPDPRFSPPHITLFLEQSSANNVRPRSYEWTALAFSTDYRREVETWAGQVQLPLRLWELARAADAGATKPYDRTVSGTDYITSWKKAAAAPLRVCLTDLQWHPQLTLWGDPAATLAHSAEALATYRRMAWKKAYYPGQHEFIPANCGDFFDMLYVWTARQPGTGNLYLQDAEGDAFLGADPRKLDLAA